MYHLYHKLGKKEKRQLPVANRHHYFAVVCCLHSSNKQLFFHFTYRVYSSAVCKRCYRFECLFISVYTFLPSSVHQLQTNMFKSSVSVFFICFFLSVSSQHNHESHRVSVIKISQQFGVN